MIHCIPSCHHKDLFTNKAAGIYFVYFTDSNRILFQIFHIYWSTRCLCSSLIIAQWNFLEISQPGLTSSKSGYLTATKNNDLFLWSWFLLYYWLSSSSQNNIPPQSLGPCNPNSSMTSSFSLSKEMRWRNGRAHLCTWDGLAALKFDDRPS